MSPSTRPAATSLTPDSAASTASTAPALPRSALFARLQARPALAIDGLPPELATLAPGHVHIVYAEPSPARDALFWQTAATALRGPATVLSARPAGGIAQALREHGLDIDVGGALHHRANLCGLRVGSDNGSGNGNGRGGAGIDTLLDALQALAEQCAARHSVMMVEGAEACFSWHDGARLSREGARLAAWCARERLSLLLVLAPPMDDAQPPADLGSLHARFAGAAHLAQVQGQFTWEVAFWRDREAVLASRSLPLRFAPDEHRLMVSGAGIDGEGGDAASTGLLAPDEHRVIVCRDAVAHERWVPESWQLVDSNEAAVASASGAVAATVLLHYHGNRAFEALAEQVHRLRRTRGSALKIVVREDQEAMRQHYELLLLNLGANLVIARRTPFARVQAMLEGVQGQVFSRPLPADYRTALSAVLTGSAIGYVPPAEFIDTVRGAVEQGRTIRLPHVLLRLTLLPEVAHIDALRACRMNRTGDICSADADSVYVFFFACRLDDADAVCRRVFQRPLEALFSGELRCGDAPTIEAALNAFAQQAAAQALPDYSGWLQAREQASEATMEQGAALPAAPAAVPASEGPQATASASPVNRARPALPLLSPLDALRPSASAQAGSRPQPRTAPAPAAVPLKTRG
ncbi:cellulose biosynthesis protein BcsE [Cupriavidus gilardii]|uniref:cellulose biosynthesis protein BcsE n=1 Tax=Cupriavidus gilardii TaxID=82541 RepID=UPI001ABE39E7|nr:cellulose biosynthesis protein BcsE [Cupriavidus gilardii]MBO4121086.1 cellulose biosynthesis protein BcsE [Cupriavidus gilardii]